MLTRAVLPPYHRLRRALLYLSGASLVIALGFVVFSSGSHMRCFCSSKEKVAKIAVRKFVYEALPQWQQIHGLVCPPDLRALTPYMNSDDVTDPWGNLYVFLCDPQRSDPRAIAISPGPDHERGTDDDIFSGP